MYQLSLKQIAKCVAEEMSEEEALQYLLDLSEELGIVDEYLAIWICKLYPNVKDKWLKNEQPNRSDSETS